jgi:putative flippase GtrA
MKISYSKNIIQFLKFATVGVFNTAIDWIVFFLVDMIHYFSFHETYTKAISFLFAAVNSFILNSLWTFKTEYRQNMQGVGTRQGKVLENSKYLIKFLIVSLVGWFLNTLIFSFLRFKTFADVETTLSKVLSLAFASLVVLIWNYLANRFWTYRASEARKR